MHARFPGPRTRLTPVAAALALSLAPIAVLAQQAVAPAAAASAPADAAAKDDDLHLTRVVVTATSTARAALQQSVSVTSLGAEDIQKMPVNSASELLRSVPGVRAESTGGEANANLTIRGVPLSAGGSRYVQWQEDGLPVLTIGDISFATPDTFLRADGFTDSIDVVRGGSASTFATNSPGGLVNFVSKTGKETGGSISYTSGLDYYQQRGDFDFGVKLAPNLSLEAGGFQRIGKGTRNTNVNVEDGGQVRVSLTRDLDNGGFLRATLKHLDDKTPAYMEVPVQVVDGVVKRLPQIDPREAFFIGSNWSQDLVRDSGGNLISTNPQDGVHARSDAFGVEAKLVFDGGWTVNEKFRRAQNSGRFISVFPAGGQPTTYTGTVPVFSVHLFNTSLDDLGNQVNDLKFQKVLDLGAQKLTLTGGLFTGQQKVVETWYWNRYNVELTDSNPRLFDDAGNVTNGAVADQTGVWGNCCMTHFDFSVESVAPYAAATWDIGAFTLDASARKDRQHVTGYWINGKSTATAYDPSTRTVVNNSADEPSYSLGGNYLFGKTLSVFGRYSRGVSWASPDRTVRGNADIASGKQAIPVNKTEQFEAGLKYHQGVYSANVTFFDAKTKEDGGFEITSQSYLKDNYRSTGIEADGAMRIGDLRLLGGVTLTNARIEGGDNDGKRPRRAAPYALQLAPSYAWGPAEFGLQFAAYGATYADNANTVKLPSYTVTNAFLNYAPTDNTLIGLGINNLFNTIGFTEGEAQDNGCCITGGTPIYEARSINGRSIRATLKYSF